MVNSNPARTARCINIIQGQIPVIEITESDCDGRVPETVLVGKRILSKAERDHKRYWRQMVGTYLRNDLELCPELPVDTVFSLKFPRSYELYGGIRENGAWDFFLFGFHRDDTMEKFDSPANFVLHAKWLAYGRPVGGCGCKPCSGTPQLQISRTLSLGGAKVQRPHDDETASRTERMRNTR